MFEFQCDPERLQKSRSVWVRSYLEPLAGLQTPFSYSVLAEIGARAAFTYYDRLGHELPFTPRNLFRHYQGRPYINLRWLCETDLDFAGIDGPQYLCKGRLTPICQGGSTGLMSGLRTRGRRKRLTGLLDSLEQEAGEIQTRARNWYAKVSDMRWTQAEILQIMEEIERFGVESLFAFLAARHNMERIAADLLALSSEKDRAASQRLLNATLSDVSNLVELDLTRHMLELAEVVAGDDQAARWLRAGNFSDWRKSVPAGPLSQSLESIIDRSGHRAVDEGELANPRWFEEPAFLFEGILAAADAGADRPSRLPSSASIQHLLETIPAKQRKEAGTKIERLRSLMSLQSRACDAYAYIGAGTRLWALAAGREAMTDGRLQKVNDVFFYELEEIKQMMTGEWNVSQLETIEQVGSERAQAYRNWQKELPDRLLLDDEEIPAGRTGLPAVEGESTGPLRRQKEIEPSLCRSAVVGAGHLDSGWAPALPVAGALLARAGTPLDPIVAAARAWHVPTVVSLIGRYESLVDGAITTLDGGSGHVEQ